MRDPELMQRADRAAIALEEAWERWRAMHGLGAEPLPPVSSYVGYSLEEPWGQPRVVFGLRADEAELLASLLEGHDCVGPIYAEVSTRPDRRRQLNAPTAPLVRPYQVSVPAQAPPSALDQVQDEPASRGQAEAGGDRAGTDGGPADGSEADWPGAEPLPGAELRPDEEDGSPEASEEPVGADHSPPLEPLPDLPDFRDDDEAATDDAPRPTGAARKRAAAPTQGPGYRGPRYQGFPKRYETEPGSEPAASQPDTDPADEDADPAPARRSQVAKLNRGTRRRASSG